MVAPSLRALGTVTSATTGSPSFDAPAGAAPSDVVMLAAFVNDGRTTVSAAPIGFSRPANAPQSNGGAGAPDHLLIVYYGRFGDVGSGPYVFILSQSVFVEGRTAAIQDCAVVGSPIDTTGGATSGTNSVATAPVCSATANGTNRYALYAATNWASGTWTAPTGFAAQWDTNTKVITFDDATLSTPQTISPQATNASTSLMNAWVGVFLPIPPPVVAPSHSKVMGWDLYSTLVQGSEYKNYYDNTLPVSCPYDGTPLREGPGSHPGVLYCPNGDFRYPDDWDSDSMSGM